MDKYNCHVKLVYTYCKKLNLFNDVNTWGYVVDKD